MEEGVTYQACIFQNGEVDSIPVDEYCADVFVNHVDRTLTLEKTKAGKKGLVIRGHEGCRVKPQAVGMLVKCERFNHVTLRYKFVLPTLTSEQEFTSERGGYVRHVDFRVGIDYLDTSTIYTVEVTPDNYYWGSIRRVTKDVANTRGVLMDKRVPPQPRVSEVEFDEDELLDDVAVREDARTGTEPGLGEDMIDTPAEVEILTDSIAERVDDEPDEALAKELLVDFGEE